MENKVLHSIVSLYINVVRSVPFIILLVTIMPLTRAILGTTIGSTAALVPLVVYISPYLARLIENSLLEVSPGILEAAQAMGATTWQIIRCFLMPEALGSMVLALTTGTVGLLGASAMAGYCGGGGVGDLALTMVMKDEYPVDDSYCHCSGHPGTTIADGRQPCFPPSA